MILFFSHGNLPSPLYCCTVIVPQDFPSIIRPMLSGYRKMLLSKSTILAFWFTGYQFPPLLIMDEGSLAMITCSVECPFISLQFFRGIVGPFATPKYHDDDCIYVGGGGRSCEDGQVCMPTFFLYRDVRNKFTNVWHIMQRWDSSGMAAGIQKSTYYGALQTFQWQLAAYNCCRHHQQQLVLLNK